MKVPLKFFVVPRARDVRIRPGENPTGAKDEATGIGVWKINVACRAGDTGSSKI
jgi:hypothetical protein